MKWIIVVFVNFLPVSDQWEMFDYRDEPFSSKVACEQFIEENKQFFIDDANRAYFRNDVDYFIGCPTLEQFIDNVEIDEIHTV